MMDNNVMKKGKNKRKDNILIFNRNNPNFNIKETNEEIASLFINKDVRVINNDKKQMIGIVVGVRGWVGDELYGDVYFWVERDNVYSFDNYAVEVEEGKIIRIAYLEFSKK